MVDKLDLSSLRNTLHALEQSTALVRDSVWFESQEDAVRETLVAGTIQNFEFVYELAVKLLRRRLLLDSATPDEVARASFRDMLRIAGELGLIERVEPWFGYRHMRNLTSHTYDRAKAREVYAGIGDFMVDARALLESLEARNG